MFRKSHLEPSTRSSSLDFELGSATSSRNMRMAHDYNQIQYEKRGSVPIMKDYVKAEDEVQWFLLQKMGTTSFRLDTQKPILIGSGNDCDISLQTPSVEKRHAVLAFEPNSNCFTVRDLNTTNGTFLNKRRISADHPETVSNLDLLRFGYGSRFGGDSGPSSLPTYYSSPSKTAKDSTTSRLESNSVLNEDNNFRRALPPKGCSSLPRKSLLTVTKSDPGGDDCEVDGLGRDYSNANSASGVLLSDRLFQRRGSGGGSVPTSSFNSGFHESPRRTLDHQCGDRSNLASRNVMQQGGSVGRSGTSRVCSPSLTLDSGRGSSSVPSSPAKEMSPVQMTTAVGGAAGGVGSSIMPSSGAGMMGGTSSSNGHSHNASPVFARKHSRPMEYLLGNQNDDGQSEPGFVPDPPASEHSSGNYASYCSSEPLLSLVPSGCSSGFVSGMNFNQKPQRARNESGDERNGNTNHGFPSDCEILQITEDYENTNVGSGVGPPRKDSLEETQNRSPVDQDVSVISNGDIDGGSCGLRQVQPQFLVGGDIMQPDLDVPNEVFGPLSHAEILNRNLSNCNLNSQSPSAGSGKQGNKPAETSSLARARSSSDDGGSNRSTPLSALYGTPHWWPDSPPPEESACPPPPVSSTNCSPFKKPFLLNNNTYNIANSQSITSSTCRLKGNSSSSSLTDHVKDLSLESTHSQKSGRTPSSSPMPANFGGASGNGLEVKKFTPMAFTIDFSDSECGTGGVTSSAAEAKKAAIAERLSKFAPRHKRNASLTRTDDAVGAKDGEPISSLSSSSKAKTNSLGRAQQHQKQSSATTTTVADSSALKSASLPKRLTGASKHPSGGSSSTNNNDSGLRSLSPETISSTTSSSSRSRPVIEHPKNTPIKSSSSTPPRDNNSSSMTRKSKNQQRSRGGTPANQRNPTRIEDKSNGVVSKPPGVTPRLNDLSKAPSPIITSPIIPTAVDKEDTVSEAGTYTVEKEAPEVQNARGKIEDVFGLHGTEEVGDDKENNCEEESKSFSVEPGTRDWVREWAELAAQQHQQKQRPELPDSQYFLRETETLVSAIQERVSKHMKYGSAVGEPGSHGLNATGSDSEDEPTLAHHTPIKSQSQLSTPTHMNKKRPPSRASPFHRESSVLSDSGYAIGYQSDSSNEGSGNKMNRAFNIRRSRVGYSSDLRSEHVLMNQQSITMPLNNGARGISPKPSQLNGSKLSNVASGGGPRSGAAHSPSPHFGRNDGGRFSLRMAKSKTPPAQMHPPAPPRQTQKGYLSGESQGRGMMNGHKSDNHSSQSQPQSGSGKKPAPGAGGKILNNSVGGGGGQQFKKPNAGNRSNSTLTAKEVELANWKRRKNYDPMKAAAEGKKGGGNKKNGTSSGGESGMEENPLPPIESSPTLNRREAMMTKSLSFHQESYSPKCGSEDEDMIYIVDEMDSSHSNSPNHMGMTRSYHEDVMFYGMPASSSSIRQKNKLEALDNLVIATIHSLSNKVRTSSKSLLEKLQLQHASDENGALLEEMVSQLKELEGPSSSVSPNKSPSRELSGTLKNLKKLEQVILVLDKVLCEDFESDMNA